MAIRLFATDMDGTLLRDIDKGFDTDLFESVLTRLSEAGAYFVVATGNQYPKSLHYMEGFTDRGIYFIAENGAYIADGQRDLKVASFDDQTVREVVAVLEDFPEAGVLYSTYGGAYIPEDRAGVISSIVQEHLEHLGSEYAQNFHYLDFMQRFYPGVEPIADAQILEGKKVVKFALTSHRKDTEQLMVRLLERLPENVLPVQSGFGAIDLISRGINKGTALEWLGERLGVKPEEMMAFGDAPNDLEMLRYAGTGVAMGNAAELVKEAADLVIGTNADGAVLKYIDQVLKNQQA